ncbi:MAG: hypothetical protein OXI25_02740 [Chloroflexota bacterium]|nr:hypothetical protein [Chloroflexota bacterium]
MAGDSETAVREALAQLGVAHELIHIDPAFADTDAFCERYGYPREKSGNTIIVASRREPRVFAACLTTADRKLDVNHKARELLGVRRLSFASADDTRELTGMMIGGVTIFGLPDGLPLYVDAAVMALDYLIIGGGGRSVKVRLAPDELHKIPGATVVEGLGIAG